MNLMKAGRLFFFFALFCAGIPSLYAQRFSIGVQPGLSVPVLNPPASDSSSPLAVTISTTTTGASIRYTTDGGDPTSTTGTLYTGSVNVASSQTLTAIAYLSGWTNSSIASAAYGIFTSATWTVRTLPQSAMWNSVTYGNGLFVAISGNGGNTAATSP